LFFLAPRAGLALQVYPFELVAFLRRSTHRAHLEYEMTTATVYIVFGSQGTMFEFMETLFESPTDAELSKSITPGSPAKSD
jgi:hypothetical protein